MRGADGPAKWAMNIKVRTKTHTHKRQHNAKHTHTQHKTQSTKHTKLPQHTHTHTEHIHTSNRTPNVTIFLIGQDRLQLLLLGQIRFDNHNNVMPSRTLLDKLMPVTNSREVSAD